VRRALTIGFFIVIAGAAATTIWLIGSTITHGASVYRSFDERCSEPSDVVFPSGSCAPPLHAADFKSGRAKLTLTVTPSGEGTRVIDYTYENRTSRYRSLDWARLELTTPTGTRVTCAGDGSTQRYAAPPSSPQSSGYGCALVGEPGRYVASFEGVAIAHLDIAD
jgi:hypothetical protein